MLYTKSRQPVTTSAMPVRHAVVLVCHPAYLSMLSGAIQSIDAQDPSFHRKVLVYDAGVAPGAPVVTAPPGWSLVVGDWQNPNSARNAGLELCADEDWICFWDADNEMTADYLRCSLPILETVGRDIAICYPEVQKVTDGKVWHRRNHPEWSLPAALQSSVCDTASFWRQQALAEVGGFSPEQCQHDDYELALRIYRAGWKAKKLPATLRHHFHGQNRSRRVTADDERKITTSLLTAWSFAFVTLWGAKTDASLKVLEWLATAAIPPHSTLYWVDNSGGTMTSILHEWSARLASRFRAITIVRAGDPHLPAAGEPYLHRARHQHVARLYNSILNKVVEEMVVTLEDDTLPPLDGVRPLLDLIRPFSPVAMAASVYRSRNAPEKACVSLRKDLWSEMPLFDRLPATPFEVGMTGGGFAIIANWALKQVLPMRCETSPTGALMGWDGNLGLALNALGYTLMAHPKVKSEHLCPEIVSHLEKKAASTGAEAMLAMAP